MPSDVIPDVEWRRREHANLRNALKLAEGRIYGPNGAAELLGVKPTTLISRLKALGLRDASRVVGGRAHASDGRFSGSNLQFSGAGSFHDHATRRVEPATRFVLDDRTERCRELALGR